MSSQSFSNNEVQENKEPCVDQPEVKVDNQLPTVSKRVDSIQTEEKHTVKAVVLRTDGSAVEITYDANPTKSVIKDILGASPTIIGEWKKINVVLLRGRYSSLSAPLNKHELRFPFKDRKLYGDILLYRVNREGMLDNFTLSEYEAFTAEKDDKLETSGVVSYTSAKETEEEEMKEMTKVVAELIEKQFERRHGRKPSAWETRTLTNTVIQNISQTIGPDERLEEYSDEDNKRSATACVSAKKQSRKKDATKLVENEEEKSYSKNACDQKQSPFGKKLTVQRKTPKTTPSKTSNGAESDEEPMSDSLRREIAEVFEIIREKGRQDARYLADLVSETFYEINGREAELQDIADVFKRVKEQLAEEANEELLDSEEQIDSVDPRTESLLVTPQKTKGIDEESRKAIESYASVALTAEMAENARKEFIKEKGREPSLKEFEDLLVSLITTRYVQAKFGNESDKGFVSSDIEANSKVCGVRQTKSEQRPARSNKPIKFFSPVRSEKSPKTGKKGLNSVDRKLVERAMKHFRSIYQREPTEEESSNLCKFLTTGDLPSIGSDDEKENAENANPNVKKLTFDDSDDDSDSNYVPEKDTTCNEEKDVAEESDDMAGLVDENAADLNLVK